MEDQNAYFRRLHTQHVATTDGIPNGYLTPVRIFRSAFPNGIAINTPDYNALCAFVSDEGYGHRQIAQILDFAFDLGYVNVLNNLGLVAPEAWKKEIARIEEVLRPHGLEAWRLEDEYGHPPKAR